MGEKSINIWYFQDFFLSLQRIFNKTKNRYGNNKEKNT